MRLNFTNFHEISSEIVSFQIRSAPQFHQFSSKIAHFQIRNFVRNGQISNKERGVPCRVGRSVGSPIRFFDPILNNALALRASHEVDARNEIFQARPQKVARTNETILARSIFDQRTQAEEAAVPAADGVASKFLLWLSKYIDRLECSHGPHAHVSCAVKSNFVPFACLPSSSPHFAAAVECSFLA